MSEVLSGPAEGLSSFEQFASGVAERHQSFGVADGWVARADWADAVFDRWTLPTALDGLDVFGADDFAGAVREYTSRTGYFSADFERGGPFVIPVDPVEAPTGFSAHQALIRSRRRQTPLQTVVSRGAPRLARTTAPVERYRSTSSGALTPYPARMGAAGATLPSLLRFPEARAQLEAGHQTALIVDGGAGYAGDASTGWGSGAPLTPALAAAEAIASRVEGIGQAAFERGKPSVFDQGAVWLAPSGTDSSVLETASRRLAGPSAGGFTRIASVPMALVANTSPATITHRGEGAGGRPIEPRGTSRPRTLETFGERMSRRTLSAARTMTSPSAAPAQSDRRAGAVTSPALTSTVLFSGGDELDVPHGAADSYTEASIPWAVDPAHGVLVRGAWQQSSRADRSTGPAAHRADARKGAGAPERRLSGRRLGAGAPAPVVPWRTSRAVLQTQGRPWVGPRGRTLISPAFGGAGEANRASARTPWLPSLAATFLTEERAGRTPWIESRAGELIRPAVIKHAEAQAPAVEAYAVGKPASSHRGETPKPIGTQNPAFVGAVDRAAPSPSAQALIGAGGSRRGPVDLPSASIWADPGALAVERFVDTRLAAIDPELVRSPSVFRAEPPRFAFGEPGTGDLVAPVADHLEQQREPLVGAEPSLGDAVREEAARMVRRIASQIAPTAAGPSASSSSTAARAAPDFVVTPNVGPGTGPATRPTPPSQRTEITHPSDLSEGRPDRVGLFAQTARQVRRRSIGRPVPLFGRRSGPVGSRAYGAQSAQILARPNSSSQPSLSGTRTDAASIGGEGLMVTRLVRRLARAMGEGVPPALSHTAYATDLRSAQALPVPSPVGAFLAGLRAVDRPRLDATNESVGASIWGQRASGLQDRAPGALAQTGSRPSEARLGGPGVMGLRAAAVHQQIRARSASLFSKSTRATSKGGPSSSPSSPLSATWQGAGEATVGSRSLGRLPASVRALLTATDLDGSPVDIGNIGASAEDGYSDFGPELARPARRLDERGSPLHPELGRPTFATRRPYSVTPDNARRALVAFDSAMAKRAGSPGLGSAERSWTSWTPSPMRGTQARDLSAGQEAILGLAASGGAGRLVSTVEPTAKPSAATWSDPSTPFLKGSAALQGRLFGDRGPQSVQAPKVGRILVDTAARAAQQALASTPGQRPGRKAETNEESRHRLAEGQIDDELSPETVDQVAREVIESLRQLMEFEAARNGEDEWD